jgi:hypothetical protein
MAQHDMTTQMQLGERVSNHEMHPEGNLQLHDAGIVQPGKNNDFAAICGFTGFVGLAMQARSSS